MQGHFLIALDDNGRNHFIYFSIKTWLIIQKIKKINPTYKDIYQVRRDRSIPKDKYDIFTDFNLETKVGINFTVNKILKINGVKFVTTRCH